MRPVLNGNLGPLSSLTEVTTNVLSKFVEEFEDQDQPTYTIRNTEQLLCKFID